MASIGDGAFVSSPDMEKFLCKLLLDSMQPISERFRALFSLRNLKGPSPRDALILGQPQKLLVLLVQIVMFLIKNSFDLDPLRSTSASCSSVDQLRKVLLDEEKGMYERYAALFALRNNGGNEAAEALGSIAGISTE
ncbi:hypothetical protein K1719_018634 [Acacia pycnantha]|nr:hypothetical protein K1719_018634 [Acacia pycnantha]